MKTIKLIDLYSNIANGKEVPKLIKYKNIIYEFRKDINDYTSDNYFLSEIFNAIGDLKIALNTEVEIIEDKPKKIDNFELRKDNGNTLIGANMWAIDYKLQELVKAVNYLLEKSDKGE